MNPYGVKIGAYSVAKKNNCSQDCCFVVLVYGLNVPGGCIVTQIFENSIAATFVPNTHTSYDNKKESGTSLEFDYVLIRD